MSITPNNQPTFTAPGAPKKNKRPQQELSEEDLDLGERPAASRKLNFDKVPSFEQRELPAIDMERISELLSDNIEVAGEPVSEDDLATIEHNLNEISKQFDIDQDDIEDNIITFCRQNEREPRNFIVGTLIDTSAYAIREIFSNLADTILNTPSQREVLFFLERIDDLQPSIEDITSIADENDMPNPWAVLGDEHAKKHLFAALKKRLDNLNQEENDNLFEEWFKYNVPCDDADEIFDFATVDLEEFKMCLDPEIFRVYPSDQRIRNFIEANKPKIQRPPAKEGNHSCSICSQDLEQTFSSSCKGCKIAFTEQPSHYWLLQSAEFEQTRTKFLSQFSCCKCKAPAVFSKFTNSGTKSEDSQFKLAFPYCSETCWCDGSWPNLKTLWTKV
jgi:hypothetical protein